MAIGDAVAQLMGTAETTRQPSSGVEEKITFMAKTGTTDRLDYLGSIIILHASVTTDLTDATASTNSRTFNMALMITNSVYIIKQGTTDTVGIGGVQTNA